MRRFLILATAVLAGGLLTACGDSTEPESIFGLYTLQTFNCDNLPAQLPPTGPVPPVGGMIILELTAGSIQLNSGDTCSVSLTFRTTITDVAGNVTVTTEAETDTCTYSVTGSTIRFDFPGEAAITGTISGNTLTIVEDGDTFVFSK